ncbi:MAG: ribosome silencing factor [Clostridia bacterium]|jgi:ribosome-associated protein|nr:ribosome silencing factor [Clostridia bacterium]
MDSLQTAQVVIDSLTKRKAYDIVKIDVKEKTSIADYFVIASARSTTQVKSLAEFCEAEAEKAGAKILRKEGLQDGRWAIIDFGDVILHIFNDETRLFYHLERLWGEGEKIENND